ncbi:CGNR zinc finger domain-containing protein [Mangrovicoccus ximenensis]|uniref:CGNR zinc finger domain-containing protein n=1 Tax=Mangrovicoccus ximenensis TaxID=1911570 RepID=UPI000D35D023|nr:CGNR zinc finger domain-containing protein [Mangrovicoccus ximenensis]
MPCRGGRSGHLRRFAGPWAGKRRYLQLEPAPIPEAARRRPFVLADRTPLAGPQDLVIRIAEAAARLVGEADFRHVRNCEGPSCTLYFLDVSKNHRRRWCSMEVCGNRAKAAAFRKR